MATYSARATEIIEKTRSHEETLRLNGESSRSRFFLRSQPTEKVILFFHGFTAIPQQFVPIAEALFQAGHNVIIPLMPGHGQAGDWNPENPPPLPEDISIYQTFAIEWLEYAKYFGEAVVVGGLSGGGTLAMWLAVEYPQVIDRALLFSPYYANTNVLVDWVVQTLDIYFTWRPDPEVVSFGYPGFRMPALRIFLEFGQDLLEQLKTRPIAPSLVVTSERDRAINLSDLETLFHRALQHQSRCWYICFDETLDIEHNMMTAAEGNEHQDLVIAIAQAYVSSPLTWAEAMPYVLAIAQGDQVEESLEQLYSTHLRSQPKDSSFE
ncbi:alpha/beta hydrolase [Myxacorys almedinensis]|uniref:Alpha/beta fold hydrolase n=1 Tax=Myxacorys almedinensis A TaxID=2690445 RepID=A0A8J8CIW2_9CYAN|nr:alpha/beta fold hydrolase [Myxacorys almedinensis]NDJ18019.1 alpha/beta fold hydrolase [Myxacorys almedinensis A]